MPPGAGKFMWLIANPSNILTAALVVGALLLFTRFRRAGRAVVAVTALSAAAIAFAPIGDWLIEPLEARFAPQRDNIASVSGIIVLGGAIDTRQTRRYGQIALNARAERLTAFVELAHRYPSTKLVYTGGAGESDVEADSEAAIAKNLLAVLGVPESRLMLETKSRDTFENARFSFDLVKPKPDDTWILVTSAFHMPRAVGAFRHAGWNVVPYPVDYRRGARSEDTSGRNLGHGLQTLNVALREWLGLALYYADGRIDRLLPEQRP